MENLLTKLDQTARQELAKGVYQKFISSAHFYQDEHDLWRTCWEEYGGEKDDKDETDEPDIKIGLAYSLVENVVARCVQAFLGNPSIITKPKRKDHHKKAENYDTIIRGYRASPDYRINAIDSTRERVICGTSWEVDEWANNYVDGLIWVKTAAEKVVDMDIPVVSKVAKVVSKVAFKAWKKVKHRFPVEVGYKVRFPSIFDMFPQPGRTRLEACEWVIERVRYKSVADLKEAKYTDPETGELVPIYDISELEEMQESKIKIRPVQFNEGLDYEAFRADYTRQSETDSQYDDGVDAVALLILRTDREIITIANGSHVIQHVKDLYHKPGKHIRIRYYTQNRHSIYGKGIIEPILDLIDELHDVHNMSMQSWFREVNRMMAYNEDAIPYPDDLNRRAGGLVRVKQGMDPRRALMPIESRPPGGEMITAEANLRGLTENIVSVADMSPGPLGTKPYHKTYGGMMEIQSTFDRRFGVIAALDQAATMKQYDDAYWLHEQFMFNDVLVPVAGKGGANAVSFSREDIDTQGEGFLFIASDDPSFGDTQVQRNQNMVLMDLCLRYVQARQALNKTEWRDVKADEVLEDVFESFGRYDVDKLLVVDEGVTSPEKEYELMLQGVAPEVNPKESLTWHLIKHMIQLQMLRNSGQNIPPQVEAMLVNHMSNTQQAIMAVGQNPEMFAAEYAQVEAMRDSVQATMPAPNVGQNLPQAQGAE